MQIDHGLRCLPLEQFHPGLLRDTATAVLDTEAAKLESENPDTSAVLKFIARRIGGQEDSPLELILEKIGADYFKFSAYDIGTA